MAQKDGKAIYVDDGSNRWPAVHKVVAAVLFRLALEKGTPSATCHAVAEQGIPVKDIVTAMGKHLQMPVQGKALSEAAESMGMIAHIASLDSPTSRENSKRAGLDANADWLAGGCGKELLFSKCRILSGKQNSVRCMYTRMTLLNLDSQ